MNGLVARAFVADALLVVVFAVIGRASHDEDVLGPGGSGLLQTSWPFLVALVVGWLITLAWRRPLAPVRTGLGVWIITVIGGMLLRAVSGQGTAVAFIIVAAVTLLVLLVGWRVVEGLRLGLAPAGSGAEDKNVPSSFTVTTRTAASVEDLFDASLSIDEHLESMRSSGEQAVAGVTSGTIGLGESVTWRARHFGIRFTMTSRITALDRPRRFVDEQTRGPFRSFRHEHVFRTDASGTVMLDTLTVGSPTFGVPAFGTLVERLILVPYLRRAHPAEERSPRHGGRASAAIRIRIWSTGRARIRGFDGLRHPPSSVAARRLDARDARCAAMVGQDPQRVRVDSPGPVEVGDRPVIHVRALGVSSRPRPSRRLVHERSGGLRVPHPSRASRARRRILRRESRGRLPARGRALHGPLLTAPAPHQPWRMLHPALRLAQRLVKWRYLRALR